MPHLPAMSVSLLLLSAIPVRGAVPGQVWAWGLNDAGQLGKVVNSGSSEPNPVPVEVNGLTGVVAVAAGAEHSLALKSDGTVWAWGSNWAGALGAETGIERPNPTPVRVSGLTGITAIAAGRSHSLALRNDGTVWAWGYNGDNELGQPAVFPGYSSVPSQVPGISNVIAIAAGGYHSLALKRDGSVWGWGGDQYGQAGGGADPVVSAQRINGLSGVVAIAASWLHSLALENDGSVWAWGYNADGQTGAARGSQPNPSPVPVGALPAATAIAAGARFSLTLAADGSVWSWGNGVPTPARVSGLLPVQVIAAGELQGLGMESDGTLWAWGNNSYGQLGNDLNLGSSAASLNPPVRVSGLSGVVSAAGGSMHSLAISTGPPAQLSINAGGVVDAASYRPLLSPGGIFSIFGANLAADREAAKGAPLPTTLQNTTVTFDGIAAPLFFVSPGQINAQVPFEVQPGAVTMAVSRADGGDASQPVTVQSAAPAIFAVNGQGTGPGAIGHALTGGAVNDASPGEVGEYVSIFCTGLGPVGGAISGEPSPAREVAVRPGVSIAGIPATVTYAGLAPGFVGLYQVNAQVPPTAPTGASKEVKIAAGASESNTVTMALVNPAPVLSSVQVAEDAGGFFLAVVGTGFIPTSVASMDSRNEPTTFVSTTQLGVLVPADQVTPGSHVVRISNPPPRGGVSIPWEVQFSHNLSGVWRGSWLNTAGLGGSIEATLQPATPGYSGSLNLTGSNIVSQCTVVAGADLASVWLDAACNGYGGLTYLIHFSGKISNATQIAGDWTVSAVNTVLDSGTFTATRAGP